jgi:hypothetical protein
MPLLPAGFVYTFKIWGPDGVWYEGNTYASFVGLYSGEEPLA